MQLSMAGIAKLGKITNLNLKTAATTQITRVPLNEIWIITHICLVSTYFDGETPDATFHIKAGTSDVNPPITSTLANTNDVQFCTLDTSILVQSDNTVSFVVDTASTATNDLCTIILYGVRYA